MANSWKVQFQLDKEFGLYHSELLPKNHLYSMVEYNVPCCMQIWSKTSLGKDIRGREDKLNI